MLHLFMGALSAPQTPRVRGRAAAGRPRAPLSRPACLLIYVLSYSYEKGGLARCAMTDVRKSLRSLYETISLCMTIFHIVFFRKTWHTLFLAFAA